MGGPIWRAIGCQLVLVVKFHHHIQVDWCKHTIELMIVNGVERGYARRVRKVSRLQCFAKPYF
jgi:hypothetical protein